MAASNTLLDQWQYGKTLSECLGYILDNEVSCDIMFLLGESKTEVKAHKTLLIARSPVFYAMLDGPMKEKDMIEIPDIDADTFRILLKFIYTDEVYITADDVMSVLYASKKYGLEILSHKCAEFLEANLSDENVCLLYEQSHVYDENDLHDKCFKYINTCAEACLKNEHFRDLCPACCDSLISSDKLSVQEELVYEAMLKWSDSECQRHHLDVSNSNRRTVLKSLLYKIRFPLIDSDYFVKYIFTRDLLSEKEKLAVTRITQNKITKDPENLFICCRRSRNPNSFEEPIIRFQTSESSDSIAWDYSGTADAISFRSSNDVYMHGVCLYGDEMSSTYNVKLDIINANNEIISSVEKQYCADPETWLSDIVLENPVKIAKDKTYTVKALISGPHSAAGQDGIETVYFKSRKISFLTNSIVEKSRTSTRSGQIPGLLLSSV